MAMPGAGEIGALSDAAAIAAAAAARPAGPSAEARTAATPRPACAGVESATWACPGRIRPMPSVYACGDGRIVVSSPFSAQSGT